MNYISYPEGHVFYRELKRSYPLCVKGQGIYLYDQNGKRYIDGSGGPVCANIGHGVEEIAEAARNQIQKVAYVHGSQFTTTPVEQYARALAEVLPPGVDKIYFLAGGSEATEASLKLARQYHLESGNHQKYKVIGLWHSYHGDTMGALSMSGKVSMRKPFLPLLSSFPHIPPPYCYRCHFGTTYPHCDLECARILERAIELEGPETISAFIAEPIIGATVGAVVPPKEYYPITKDICNRFNLLFIADEVMTGFGRTGEWFAINHWGVVPDIVAMAKGIAGGYVPLGAMATRKEVVDVIKNGSGNFIHGHTFSHHPVICAVGLAVLRYIKNHNLVEQSARRGQYLLQKLNELRGFSFVGDVRGKGLMTAIEFVKEKKTKVPFPRTSHFTEKILGKVFERGLALYPSIGFVDGVNGDAVMISPPFIIEEGEIDEIIGILQEVFIEVENERSRCS